MDKWPTKSMESGYGPAPKRPVEVEASAEEVAIEAQRAAVIALLTEIVQSADIVGQEADGKSVYLVSLSPPNSDTLAALFAYMEDGDELDKGEGEHDGREPDPEDAT